MATDTEAVGLGDRAAGASHRNRAGDAGYWEM